MFGQRAKEMAGEEVSVAPHGEEAHLRRLEP